MTRTALLVAVVLVGAVAVVSVGVAMFIVRVEPFEWLHA
jgi:hypothetical protein